MDNKKESISDEVQKCDYAISRMDGGLFRFDFFANSHTALDAFFDMARQSYADFPEAETWRGLVVVHTGQVPPITHIFEVANHLQRGYPTRPSSRVALVLMSTTLARLVNAVVRLTNDPGRDETRVYGPGQMEEALTWLRQ